MITKMKISNFLSGTILFVLDVLVVFLLLKITLYFRTNYFIEYLPVFNDFNLEKYTWIILVISLALIYEKIYFVRYDFWGETKRVYKALFLSSVIILSIISLTKMNDDYSRVFLIFFFVFMFIFIPLFKRLFKSILFKFDFFKQGIKVIGISYSLIKKIENEINTNWYFGYKILEKKYNIVIIVSKNINTVNLQKIIKRYTKYTRNIYIVPYMYHLDFTHSNIVDYSNIRLSAIHLENRLLNSQNTFIKFFFEKIIVILLLPFALLLHILLTILIKIDSEGGVFFKQKRLGKNGKTFICYKYRSMYTNGDEILREYLKENPEEIEYYSIYHKYKNDPRITKIGKILRATSLDEFPQFFNILIGDMNLIGPRPYMLNEKQKIGKLNEEVILRVNPGITGLWQVSGRNNLTFDERIELDKWYIQNWSLWIDFVIFVRTIKVVLYKVGAR